MIKTIQRVSILILMIFVKVQISFAVNHPMDALTREEIKQTVDLLKSKDIANDESQYPYIGLLEMDKKDVRAWQYGDPIKRMAKVILYHEKETYELELDLDKNEVMNQKKMLNVEPSVMAKEWHIANNLVMKDKTFQEHLAKRQLTNMDNIYCSPNPAGYFSRNNYDDKRIFKVPCYEKSHSKNHLYGRPIEGLFAVVDVENEKILEIIDDGVTTLPPPVFDYESGKNDREALNPVFSISPQGHNFKLKDGVLVDWQNWQFHMRLDKRVGAVLSLVRFNDQGKMRDIAYQINMAEMFVPYQDPSDNWYYRSFMDNGEFGLGLLTSSLNPGADCPVEAAYLNLFLPNDYGNPFMVERAACIFERNIGEPLWRHGVSGKISNQSRPKIELIVRTIPVLGNYDYVIDYVFDQNGKMEIRLGATGILAAKTVATETMKDPSAKDDTKYGSLVAPKVVAPNHSHHFSFRMDLDIDGIENQLVSDIVGPVELDDDHPKDEIWVAREFPIEKEGAIAPTHFQKQWRIKNPNKENALAHNPSYQLMLGHIGTSLSSTDHSQRRALFSRYPLWVSEYKKNELYSAGDYPNQSKGGDGLPKFVEEESNIENKDIVVWPTVGFDHLPRTEDWPIMPSMYLRLGLRPFNFFNQNPSMDVPRFFKPLPPPNPNLLMQPPATTASPAPTN